ncbi:MAG: hypothetical protein QW379_01845, partial [Thermoplasmata archaeon]
NVSNTGNFEDFLELTTLEMPRNWSVGLRPGWSLRLAPLSSVEVTVLIESSSDFINSPYGEHVVLLQATAARTGLVQNLSFRVPVRRVGSWELLAISSTIVELNLSQSTSVSIPVSIRSNGNFRDTLSLSIEGGAARWASLPFGSLSLSPGEEEVFGVLIDVPTDTPTGTYGLLLLASSSGGTGISRELALSIVVSGRGLAPAGPEILLFVPQSELRLRGGGEAELTVRISCTSGEVANLSLNATTSHPSELSVRLLSGPLNLRAGQSSSWRLLVSAARHRGPSLHATLFLTAVGDGYVGDTRSLSVTVEPAGEPGPAVSMEYLLPLLAIFLILGRIALGWNELVLLALTNLPLLHPILPPILNYAGRRFWTRTYAAGFTTTSSPNRGTPTTQSRSISASRTGPWPIPYEFFEGGFIKSVRDGLYKRFYPVEARVTKRAGEFTTIQEVVLESICAWQGITQSELARRMSVSAQAFNYHAHQLPATGAIRLEMSGRETLCYIGRATSLSGAIEEVLRYPVLPTRSPFLFVHFMKNSQGLHPDLNAPPLSLPPLPLIRELPRRPMGIDRADRTRPEAAQGGEGEQGAGLHFQVQDALARELVDKPRPAQREALDLAALGAVEARRSGSKS